MLDPPEQVLRTLPLVVQAVVALFSRQSDFAILGYLGQMALQEEVVVSLLADEP